MKCFFLVALVAANAVLLLAAPGEKGVCSANCQNAGASCVIDMERSSASCGKCSRGTTIFQSCYIPNGKCSKMCTKAGNSCEVGRDLRVSECGDCKGPDGADVPVEDACTPVPNGRCDTKCGNPLASCSPSLTVTPRECGGCPTAMSPEIACREDYGRCSTKCTEKGKSCKPDMREFPRECGTCNQELTPAESCTTPPDGVCSDSCSRARAACTQALPGTTAMPAACGACFVNAEEACIPVDAKCRVSMADGSGSEVVPLRIDGNTAVYRKQGRSGQTVTFNIVVLGASDACRKPMAAMNKGTASLQEINSNIPGAKMYQVKAHMPKIKSGKVEVTIEGCCGDMKTEILVPGGGSCMAWGDPHLISFDQMRYSYQGVGDYVMVHTLPGSEAAKAGGDLAVQMRFVPMYKLIFDKNTNSWAERLTSKSKRPISTVRAVAATEGNLHIAMYSYHYASSGRAHSSVFVVAKAGTTVNGIDVRTMTGSTAQLIPGEPQHGTLNKGRSGVTLEMGSGTQIKYNRFDSQLSMSSNIAVRASPTYYGSPNSVRGMCGDMDGDKENDIHSKLDDSQTFSQPKRHLYELPHQDVICETWKVTSELDSLFHYDNNVPGLQKSELPVDDTMMPSFHQVSNAPYFRAFGHSNLQSKTMRLFATDPTLSADPKVLAEAKEACKLLSPPFAAEIDGDNCIHDFIIAAEVMGDSEAGKAAAGAFVDAKADACKAQQGNDNTKCKASGDGCEDLNGCNNKGKCVSGHCQCVAGATGADCSIPSACDDKTSCGKHGKCVRSLSGSRTYDCDCNPGFGGEQCEFVITADGKVLKLAGGVADGEKPNDQQTFVPTSSKGVGAGVLAGIAIAFIAIAGGVIGGVIYYRKSQPQAATSKPLKPTGVTSSGSIRASNSTRGSNSVQMTAGNDRPSTPSGKGRRPNQC